MVEIILVSPKDSRPDISFEDAPTVPEYQTTYATAQAVTPDEPVYKTYGELWRALISCEDRTSYYFAM